MNKLICYQLVGVPGSGKSTWVSNMKPALHNCAVVSTDMWVEMEAERLGKTYSEIFNEYMPKAVELMANHVNLCKESEMNIVWDQTSTTISSRKKKFNMLPGYKHIAVVFDTPPADELMVRLASRPGKIIPLDVVANMIEKFEQPTKDEGFEEIWRIAK